MPDEGEGSSNEIFVLVLQEGAGKEYGLPKSASECMDSESIDAEPGGWSRGGGMEVNRRDKKVMEASTYYRNQPVSA
jgi:hypothetical protein